MVRAGSLIAIACATACGGDDPVDDPDRTELGDGTEPVQRYDVAFDGAGYAVAFTTYAGRASDDRLWFTRVSTTGAITLPATPVLDLGISVESFQLFAVGGSYVVWYREDAGGTRDFHALRIDANGQAVGDPVQLGRSTGEYGQTVTPTGTGFFVITNRSGIPDTVNLTRIAPDLTITSEGVIEISLEDQHDPYIVWSPVDDAALALWEEVSRVRAVRLTSAGGLVGTSAELVGGPASEHFPRGAAGNGLVASWCEDNGRRTHLATSATGGWSWTLHRDPIPANRSERQEIAMVVRGGEATVAWQSDATTALTQIVTGHLDLPGGMLRDVRALTAGREPHAPPRLAAGAGEVGLIYAGAVAGSNRLYFTTID